MSLLAKMLQAKQPLFEHALRQLEERTGKHGVDAALAGEIVALAANRARYLGLEPDCSSKQLHQALIKRVKGDDERLAGLLGASDPTDLRQLAPLIMGRIEGLDLPKAGYFIKTEVARRFLTGKPPAKIMRHLGYKSVKQLLASEDIYELMLALRFAESSAWLNAFNRLYVGLRAADFESRQIKVVSFDAAKWGDIAEKFITKKLHNITHSKEMGAIALMPVPDKHAHMPGVTIKVMPLILHYFNEVRLYSAFFKLVKHKRNFGDIVARTLIADTPTVSITSGQTVHWRVIQRYFGKLPHEHHPEIFEPHVQPEDLHWRKAEDVLYEIDPQLRFWDGLDFVGVLKEDQLISFNLMDVSLSYSNQLSYADRYVYHFRESLWNEIFARYLGHRNLREQVLVKLDNNLIAPETLKL